MKQVWKCDHCSQTNNDPDKILKHESVCVFNKITKHVDVFFIDEDNEYYEWVTKDVKN